MGPRALREVFYQALTRYARSWLELRAVGMVRRLSAFEEPQRLDTVTTGVLRFLSGSFRVDCRVELIGVSLKD